MNQQQFWIGVVSKDHVDLATAGVLCAEVLRRGVGVAHAVGTYDGASARIEVTHPRELATRFA